MPVLRKEPPVANVRARFGPALSSNPAKSPDDGFLGLNGVYLGGWGACGSRYPREAGRGATTRDAGAFAFVPVKANRDYASRHIVVGLTAEGFGDLWNFRYRRSMGAAGPLE
jgi:hypothetical protein